MLLRLISPTHQLVVRCDDQYNLSFFSTEEEAENALQSAKAFLNEMENLFKTILKFTNLFEVYHKNFSNKIVYDRINLVPQ